MAISTYSELQTAVGNWLDRTDLSARIPEFIALGEARLNRELRIRMMETDATLSTSSGSRTVSLSSLTRFLEPVALFITQTWGREELTFRPSHIETDTTDGKPEFWTINGENIEFEREADATYTLTLKYLKALAIATDSTNWLLTNYPDAYLAAALAEGFSYTLESEATAFWTAKLTATIQEVNRKEGRNRSMAKLRTEVADMLTGGASYDITRGY